MKIYSNDFSDNQFLDSRFTCDGGHTRPHLAWTDIPVVAKALALCMFDPDAPGVGFLHWLVVNLPAQDLSLASSTQLPSAAVQIKNDAGKFEYHGPCPPSGVHRYQFILSALDVETINPEDYQDFLYQIEGHVLDRVMITGLYERKR